MDWKETVLPRVERNQAIGVTNPSGDDKLLRVVAEKQAKVSYMAGEVDGEDKGILKGRREVVAFMNQYERSSLGGIFCLPAGEWQRQQKDWGIEPEPVLMDDGFTLDSDGSVR